MDTSQFGQETGGDDIYFDEAEDSEDEGASNNVEDGNLNRRNNSTVTKNLYDDMTDSEDSDTEEGE